MRRTGTRCPSSLFLQKYKYSLDVGEKVKDYIQLKKFPIKDVLKILLMDKTSDKNITFATNSYVDYGIIFSENSYITERKILGIAECEIQPRICKAFKQQAIRTKNKAEVFTPSWICNRMNNFCDEEWFGEKNIFNAENGTKWITKPDKIKFIDKKIWQKYVDLRFLEITCGECPYLVSRYDTSTGDEIPIHERIGILDRKLRVVGENTDNEEDWLKWVIRAYQSIYGYEYQGDNLLIARINLLITFCEYLKLRWNREPTINELNKIGNIISWNIFQMNGLNGRLAIYGIDDYKQMTIFSQTTVESEKEENSCYIYNWRVRKKIKFNDIKGNKKMKFDFVIGNPPYQEMMDGTSDKPVYNYFMSKAYEIADKVELITPARFLFNAGKTPKEWNKLMLEDVHLKILYYEPKSNKIFRNTDIKGGVCISYHDKTKDFGALGIFTIFSELNSILRKVLSKSAKFLDSLVYAPESYKFTKKIHEDNPYIESLLSKGHKFDITSNIFDKLDGIAFFEQKPNDEFEYIQIYGRKSSVRIYEYIRKDYIMTNENLEKWKLFIPKANGTGMLGEVLTMPIISQPNVGHTQTFISIGKFDTEQEVVALLKYIKTKFLRTMLGILKVTQDNKKSVWKYVPMQDFTAQSDIDWTKSVAEIDRQLYQKYGLTQQEIDFIEEKIKEME